METKRNELEHLSPNDEVDDSPIHHGDSFQFDKVDEESSPEPLSAIKTPPEEIQPDFYDEKLEDIPEESFDSKISPDDYKKMSTRNISRQTASFGANDDFNHEKLTSTRKPLKISEEDISISEISSEGCISLEKRFQKERKLTSQKSRSSPNTSPHSKDFKLKMKTMKDFSQNKIPLKIKDRDQDDDSQTDASGMHEESKESPISKLKVPEYEFIVNLYNNTGKECQFTIKGKIKVRAMNYFPTSVSKSQANPLMGKKVDAFLFTIVEKKSQKTYYLEYPIPSEYKIQAHDEENCYK